jgi:tungstate transport system substrate-binding protein
VKQLVKNTLVAAALTVIGGGQAWSAETSIIVQSTTSTANSGLYDHLLPMFKRETGITVNVVAVGTGQALKNARNCDGDLLLVHAKSAEQKFVSEGYGVERHDVMYNDFIFVGPPADPASIAGSKSALDVLARISSSQSKFASRGDNSGTHKKEMALWKEASIDPTQGSGKWYLETGSGMGATLNAALDQLQEQAGFRDPARGRRRAVQSIRHHHGQPGKMRPGKARGVTALYRLDPVGQRTGSDRGLPDERSTTVFPQRQVARDCE